MDEELVLDGNAVAGALVVAYGVDITARAGTCAHCGTVSPVGTLRAYTRGPGIVLRCPACNGAVIRVVETPSGVRLDAGGLAALSDEEHG